MILNDTIIAPATALGEGGIAIVRISGPRALESLKTYFRPSSKSSKYQSRRLYHGFLVDHNKEHVDEVMAVFMASPHTYTCDDIVEIHTHGSQQIVKKILDLYIRFGLRLAEPGEFTYRAFANGRLDLSQAEAVSRLIHAKSEHARKLSLAQVEGQLSRSIHQYTDQLRQVQVLLEAWIDFPEEDLPAEDLAYLKNTVSSVSDEISQLSETYSTGKVLTEGASILLLGRPNVGKSSLLNHLLGEDRAIVTDIPGTTRDIIEESITLAGVPVRLIDTAGLRESHDPVEKEGVRRTRQKIEQADLVLLLIDGSQSIDQQDIDIYRECLGSDTFVVQTKVDLPQHARFDFVEDKIYPISIKENRGVEYLKTSIADRLLSGYLQSNNSVVVAEQRHYEALIAANRCLGVFMDSIDKQTPLEFLSFDIREALQYLGAISGETTTDSVLSGIFSNFCIGK